MSGGFAAWSPPRPCGALVEPCRTCSTGSGSPSLSTPASASTASPSLALDGFRGGQPAPAFRVSDVAVGGWAAPGATEDEARWSRRLAVRADQLAEHRVSFFTLENQDVGHPIDWNRDHESGRAAPRRLALSIDYRSF